MAVKKYRQSHQGFTLVETMAALVIFLIVLGVMMPLFTSRSLSTINNEVQTGAVAVSQQVFDRLRQTDVATMPTTGSYTTLPSGESIASIKPSPTDTKTYSATITYCATSSLCSASARHITVQVSQNGQAIYTVETVYTRLQ